MDPILVEALPYLAIPVLAISLAGVVTAFYRPSRTMRSYIQHFAAGMVFSAVAAELLPNVEEHRIVTVIIGFAVGTAVMFLVKWLTEEVMEARVGAPAENGEGVNLGLLATVAIDMLVDGLLIGIGFILGAETGLLLTIALATEGFFLSLAAAIELNSAGTSRGKVLLATIGLALILATGVIAGILLLGNVGNVVLGLVLSFGAAALLYLVTEELLVEAHEYMEEAHPAQAAAFFVGFILILSLAMAGGAH